MNQFEQSVSSSLDGIFKQLVRLNDNMARINDNLESINRRLLESNE